MIIDGTNGVTFPDGSLQAVAAKPKTLRQNVSFITGTFMTGSTAIPADNTIPQITEGDQYLPLVITPTVVGSTVEVDVCLYVTENINNTDEACVALFVNGGANAVACGMVDTGASTGTKPGLIKYSLTTGSLSPITLTVRAGANVANQLNINSGGVWSPGARYGGTMTSFITAKEYA